MSVVISHAIVLGENEKGKQRKVLIMGKGKQNNECMEFCNYNSGKSVSFEIPRVVLSHKVLWTLL